LKSIAPQLGAKQRPWAVRFLFLQNFSETHEAGFGQ